MKRSPQVSLVSRGVLARSFMRVGWHANEVAPRKLKQDQDLCFTKVDVQKPVKIRARYPIQKILFSFNFLRLTN